MPEIQMPKLSDTMTEGTLVAWKKKKGDQVSAGEVLAEIETDKATMEWESPETEPSPEIYVQEGGKVKVGHRIALSVVKVRKHQRRGEGKREGRKREEKPKSQKKKKRPEQKLRRRSNQKKKRLHRREGAEKAAPPKAEKKLNLKAMAKIEKPEERG